MLERLVNSRTGERRFDPSLLTVSGIESETPTVVLNDGQYAFSGTWRSDVVGEVVVRWHREKPAEGGGAAQPRRRVPVTSLQSQAEVYADELSQPTSQAGASASQMSQAQPSGTTAELGKVAVDEVFVPTAVLTLSRVR